jgi:colicin import membrane protein
MKTASALSVTLHVAVLAWAMISFNGKAFDVPPVEAMPVDMIPVEDFTKLSKGAKDAPKKEEPKPLIEKKQEEVKKPEEVKPKVAEKKEVVAAKEEAPPPPQPENKPDPIAEKIEKQQEQPKPQQQVAKPDRLPPKRPPVPKQPKFDADKIAALLDKREAVRNAATGSEINNAPSLGTSQGNAKRLSASELEALRARLMALWNPPVGIKNPEEFIIRVRMQLKPDGRLAGPPQVLTSGHGQLYDSARDSAIRAVFRAQPFDMLRKETYDTWKDIEVTFDPRDMFRG